MTLPGLRQAMGAERAASPLAQGCPGWIALTSVASFRFYAKAATFPRALRDADGVYYVGDAAKVHQHLGVEHYAKAMPRSSVEELHASSAQHPRFSAYRWLLHTRRVPTRPQEAGGASHPAGIAESAAARGRARSRRWRTCGWCPRQQCRNDIA